MSGARVCLDEALKEDPAFAPAWAHIGRCHRVIGKFLEDYEQNDRHAEDAFRRALALSPDLPVAHRFYTHWESEHGRADAAVARLLQHAKANRNDAQLFAALVHALRYSGLLGASVAAHEEARRLDPTVPTSVEYTFLLLGDTERLGSIDYTTEVQGAHAYLLMYGGRVEEVKTLLKQARFDHLPSGYRKMVEAMNLLDGDPSLVIAAMDEAMAIGANRDPEAVFLLGLTCAMLKAKERAVELIARSVDDGFTPIHALQRAPVLEELRDTGALTAVIERARQRQRIALAIFERGEGPSLLGVSAEKAL